MSSEKPYSFFQSVERSFDKAAIFTDWDAGILEQIKQCNSVYQMRFPVKINYFYSIASPVDFIISKLLYNIILMILMSVISLFLFYTFLKNPTTNSIRFTAIVILGGASISIVFTLMSAIAAKAQQNAALIAILGFPVILPLLLLLMRLSKSAFGEVFKDGAILQLAALIIGLDALIVVMAVILFPYLWKE